LNTIDKYPIEFKDANKNKVVADIEIKTKENGHKVFSMSGQFQNIYGQCFDEVKPANTYQKQLINFWHKHHLNDMHLGTKEQEESLKDFNGDYTAQCEQLKKINLYEVTLKNGIKYKYGHGWLHNELPKDFETELDNVITNILKIEEENANNPLSKEEQEELKELLESDKIQALKESLNLSDSDILTIITNDERRFEVTGFDYWVLTEEEAKEEARNYLEKDLWIEAIKSDMTELSFEEWQEGGISSDGYGSILNRWDGSEEEIKINNTYYYVMRY